MSQSCLEGEKKINPAHRHSHGSVTVKGTQSRTSQSEASSILYGPQPCTFTVTSTSKNKADTLDLTMFHLRLAQ